MKEQNESESEKLRNEATEFRKEVEIKEKNHFRNEDQSRWMKKWINVRGYALRET